MSRTAATTSLTLARGSTWEDTLDYYDEAGDPIDLEGALAVMQVWEYDDLYGSADTPLLEFTTTGGELVIEAIAPSTVKNRVRIAQIPPADHDVLNPDNEQKYVYGFGVQLTLPDDVVLPLARGKLVVEGAEVR